jgi:hypothetical protein
MTSFFRRSKCADGWTRASRDEAIAKVQAFAFALRVLAERLEHGETKPALFDVTFKAA